MPTAKRIYRSNWTHHSSFFPKSRWHRSLTNAWDISLTLMRSLRMTNRRWKERTSSHAGDWNQKLRMWRRWNVASLLNLKKQIVYYRPSHAETVGVNTLFRVEDWNAAFEEAGFRMPSQPRNGLTTQRWVWRMHAIRLSVIWPAI